MEDPRGPDPARALGTPVLNHQQLLTQFMLNYEDIRCLPQGILTF